MQSKVKKAIESIMDQPWEEIGREVGWVKYQQNIQKYMDEHLLNMELSDLDRTIASSAYAFYQTQFLRDLLNK